MDILVGWSCFTDGDNMQVVKWLEREVYVGYVSRSWKDEALTLNLQGFDIFATQRYSFRCMRRTAV